MVTSLELFDAIFVEFAIWITLGIAGIIGAFVLAYIRSIKQCQMETAMEVDKLNKRSFRQSQAIVAVSPRSAGLEQKKPYIFEASVSGGDIPKQFAHVKEVLGNMEYAHYALRITG